MPDGRKSIIGLSVADAVTASNLSAYYIACLVAIMLATFLPQSQAFLLTEYLRIPESEQGVISGDLNFWGEIVIIATVGLFGALSDRVGPPRLFMAGGFVVVSIAFWFYPRATTVGELLAYRLVYSAGIAAVTCMIVTVVADYVRNVSRGKASGYMGIMNGLGAMIAAFVLIKLPARFIAAGMTPLDAGIATFNIVACIALLTALLLWFGLQKNPPKHRGERPGILRTMTDGLGAARDPGYRARLRRLVRRARKPCRGGHVPGVVADNAWHGGTRNDGGPMRSRGRGWSSESPTPRPCSAPRCSASSPTASIAPRRWVSRC